MRKNLAALMSSEKMDWETPQWLFDRLHAEFSFTLDVCANASNKKLSRWYGPGSTLGSDGLACPWVDEVCWCNPPYGRECAAWVRRAYDHMMANYALTVMLVPARTDNAWWHGYARHSQVRFLKGRVQFVGADNSAAFPSAILVFEPHKVATTEYVDYVGEHRRQSTFPTKKGQKPLFQLV